MFLQEIFLNFILSARNVKAKFMPNTMHIHSSWTQGNCMREFLSSSSRQVLKSDSSNFPTCSRWFCHCHAVTIFLSLLLFSLGRNICLFSLPRRSQSYWRGKCESKRSNYWYCLLSERIPIVIFSGAEPHVSTSFTTSAKGYKRSGGYKGWKSFSWNKTH